MYKLRGVKVSNSVQLRRDDHTSGVVQLTVPKFTMGATSPRSHQGYRVPTAVSSAVTIISYPWNVAIFDLEPRVLNASSQWSIRVFHGCHEHMQNASDLIEFAQHQILIAC